MMNSACGFAPHLARLITIAITNRQKALRVDRRRMRCAIRAILHDAGIAEARIGVAVVDDPTIAKLHDEFLNDPEPTDVLSFVLEWSPHVLEARSSSAPTPPKRASRATTARPRRNCCSTLSTVRSTSWDTTTRRRANVPSCEKKNRNIRGNAE
jgi:hypothetical protein